MRSRTAAAMCAAFCRVGGMRRWPGATTAPSIGASGRQHSQTTRPLPHSPCSRITLPLRALGWSTLHPRTVSAPRSVTSTSSSARWARHAALQPARHHQPPARARDAVPRHRHRRILRARLHGTAIWTEPRHRRSARRWLARHVPEPLAPEPRLPASTVPATDAYRRVSVCP